MLGDYQKHRAVQQKDFDEEHLEPIEKINPKDREGKEIIEKDGKQFIKTVIKKKGF